MKNKFLTLLVLVPVLCSGQSWSLLSTIKLKKPITSYSIDNEGKIYLGTSLGETFRYNHEGSEELHFSDIANSPITTTEAWNRLKVFTFFRDIQRIALLDRFSSTPTYYDVNGYQSDMAWLSTLGIDNSLWILSTEYNELRKFNIQTKALLFSTPLGVDLSRVDHMRAYQNLVIISDQKEGFHIFDQYANYIKTISFKGANYFHIYENQIVSLIENEIIFIDVFTGVSKRLKAPEGAFSGILIGLGRYYFIVGNKVKIYSTAP